jgi:DNA-binding transcriptional LysR family regulator
VDISWLESFLALLEHGSFTRAAEAQHLSQPAFSRRIQALEQWFGAELVDRSTFPVALTPAGVKVRAQAAEMVSGIGAVRDEIRGRQLMPHEAVRVSTSHTLAAIYFAHWWPRISGESTVPCLLLPSNTLDGYEALVHGGCDLLLAYADPVHPLGLDGTDVEWLVVARDHLAPYTALRDREPRFRLPGTPGHPVPFVSHGQNAFLGRVTERLTAGRTLNLRPVVQSDLTSALATLVCAGVGVGWLPGLLAEPAAEAGVVDRLDDPLLYVELEIRLHRRRTKRMTRQTAAVWERAERFAIDGG